MRIYLAPMEGVVDSLMRDLLTQIGGFDRCVTEFVRVVDRTLPRHVFHRYCPELKQGGLTAAGVPVYLQLLGGHPGVLAANARKAAKLGAPGIDINFGCPSKTVNKSDGGSVILREPDRVYAILASVRDAVPAETPVTAKIRLGYEDADGFADILKAVSASKVDGLCIHARTKKQGYKPPAYWHEVGRLRHLIKMPVTINGEIWSIESARQAREISGCEDIMIGRGAIACPDLALQIRQHHLDQRYQPMPWQSVLPWLQKQSEEVHQSMPKYAASRTKQWMTYLKQHYTEAAILFEQVKRCRTVPEMQAIWSRAL